MIQDPRIVDVLHRRVVGMLEQAEHELQLNLTSERYAIWAARLFDALQMMVEQHVPSRIPPTDKPLPQPEA